MHLLQTPIRRSILVVWVISVLAVICLSLSPRVAFPLDFDNADKVYHMLAYLWLGTLPFFAFMGRKAALACALSMIPMGAGLEIAQHYVPGRLFSPADMAANCLGVVLGIWLARRTKRLRPSRG